MNSTSWKTALWDISWEELNTERFSVIGDCSFDEQKGVSLVLPFGDLSQSRALAIDGVYAHSIETRHYDHLVGITQDGKRIALLGAHSRGVSSHVLGSTTESFFANTVYVSKSEFDPSAKVVHAELGLFGITEWLGPRIFPSMHNGYDQLHSNGIDEVIPLFECDRYSITLHYGYTRPSNSKNEVESHVFSDVEVAFKEHVSLDTLWHDIVWTLQCLFALFYGFCPSVEYLKVTLCGCSDTIDVYRASFRSPNRKVSKANCPITFASLQDGGLRKATYYLFELKGEERHAVEIMTSLLGGWDAPFELILMAANTMIEALARARNGALYSKTEFNDLVKPMIDAAPEEIKQRAEGVLSLLMNPSYPMLLDRIRQECQPWLSHLICNWKVFKKEQIELRNNGAHGKAGEGINQMMIDHYYAQICLAYYVLMTRMGLGDDVINRFEESQFLNAARWNIQKHYSAPSAV